MAIIMVEAYGVSRTRDEKRSNRQADHASVGELHPPKRWRRLEDDGNLGIGGL